MDNAIYFIGLLLISFFAFGILYFVSKSGKGSLSKTGFDMARYILDCYGLSDVYIVEVKGNFKDHYDFDQNVVRLSTNVYNGNSVYANIIAAYYAMYAVNTKEEKQYFKIQKTLNGLFTFITYVILFVFIIGIFLSSGLVAFAVLALLLVYLYCIFLLYGTYLNVKKIKETNLEDKVMIEKSLWFVYFIPFASLIVNVKNVLTDLLQDIKNKR